MTVPGSNSAEDINAYWQGVYTNASGKGIPSIPSQFAAFVAGELVPAALVVEIGCGNGRDAIFLGQYGHQVIGFDSSMAAIEHCKELEPRGSKVTFQCADISSPNVLAELQPMLVRQGITEIMVYSRFFLHAVPHSIQTALLCLVKTLGTRLPTRLAVEFRTLHDAALPKTAPDHFRRFVDPLELVDEAEGLGFKTDYFVEGIGYAKRGSEDAHVARCIFSI